MQRKKMVWKGLRQQCTILHNNDITGKLFELNVSLMLLLHLQETHQAFHYVRRQ